MTRLEQFLRYLRRETAEGIPFDIGFHPNAEKAFAARLGGQSERAYFGCVTRDVRPDFLAAKQIGDAARWYPDGIPEKAFVDEWGICTQISKSGLVHVIPPMSEFESAEQFADYPFPNYQNPACYAKMREQVAEIKASGLVAVAKAERLIFAMGRDLRGYENHLMDYCINEELNEALLDRILECQKELVRGMAATGADILWLSSDVASQDNVFLRPEVYHRTVAWRMAELYRAAKEVNPALLCAYHCCGNVVPIMEDILQFGVDILNPIQPESLNLREFKQNYGDKLVLWGGVSVQHVLPFGTTKEVRAAVRDVCAVLGTGGGFVVSPCNEVTEDIPWENLEAFADEAQRFGVNR